VRQGEVSRARLYATAWRLTRRCLESEYEQSLVLANTRYDLVPLPQGAAPPLGVKRTTLLYTMETLGIARQPS
jgi:hypothetical protein